MKSRLIRPIDPLAFIFLGVGAATLAVCVFLTVRASTFRSRALTAEGTVVDLRYERSGRKGSVYFPVVRYETQDGREIEFKNGTGQDPPAHRKGERVEVLYEPDRPERASINGFMDLYLGSLIFGFLGAIFAAVGAGIGWADKRRR